jgi:uncharacterized repeat protein (TIGR01451 family)
MAICCPHTRKAFLFQFAAFFLFAASIQATTYTVINTNDSGSGTLRQAITDANGNAGADIIAFNIPGSGVHTIWPAAGLPAITDTVVIDGYTQSGAKTNSLVQGDNAVLLIQVNGTSAGGFGTAGLALAASGCTVRGLAIGSFEGDIIDIGGSSNVIAGNFLGTDATGMTNEGGFGDVVNVGAGTGNVIGGTTPGARNILSGCNGAGVDMSSGSGSSTLVMGNFIGTDASGTHALGNGAGAYMNNGSANNIIGGTVPGARNIISGNGGVGIEILNGGTSGNIIEGNFIGTDVTGTSAVPNGSPSASSGNDGVDVEFAGSNNIVGGLTAGARNIISGNNGSGVTVIANQFSGTTFVEGNYIGVDVTGTKALGNRNNGVTMDCQFTTIGGSAAGAGNVISGNSAEGIQMFGEESTMSNNVIQGNFIGTDATGTVGLGQDNGIDMMNASFNIIGLNPDGSGAGNVIAFNNRNGIRIQDGNFGTVTIGNSIRGNSIFSNGQMGGGLGINFNSTSAPLPNDPCDTDTGPNNLQNFPELTAVVINSSRPAPEARIAGAAGRGPTLKVSTVGSTAANSVSGNSLSSAAALAGVSVQSDAVIPTVKLGNAVIRRSPARQMAAFYAASGNRTSSGSSIGGTATAEALANATSAGPFSNDPQPNGQPTSVTVSGSLDSASNTVFMVDFYANTTVNASGFGEGQMYLGSTNLQTGTDCTLSFQNITFPLPAGAGQFITATATDPGGNTSEFSRAYPHTGVNPTNADISVAIGVSPDTISVGSNFTLTISAENKGPADATNAVVTNPLPNKTTFVSATTTLGTVTFTNGVVTANLGLLASATAQTITIVATANSVGDVVDNATITSSTIDLASFDNTDSTSFTVQPVRPPGTADLAIELFGGGNIAPGDTTTLSACADNNGPDNATNVVITAVLPPNCNVLSVTSDDTTNITVTGRTIVARYPGSLESGFFGRVCLNAAIQATNPGTLIFQGSASSDTPDINPQDNSSVAEVFVGTGPHVLVVVNTHDNGPGSFRQALMDSESNPGKDIITFDIPETDPGLDPQSGAFLIVPIKPLPGLSDQHGVIIDGYTQPGSSPNTLTNSDNAVVRIEIDGSQSQKPSIGLTLGGGPSLVRGICLNRFLGIFSQTDSAFEDGFAFDLSSPSNVIEGCFIGTDATGTKVRGNDLAGFFVGSSGNLIGGTNPAARNILSGSPSQVGIATSTFSNVVVGNFIGTDRSGTNPLPSNIIAVDGRGLGNAGLAVSGMGSRIGGTTPEERNIISGNREDGIFVSGVQNAGDSEYNTFEGNYIGTDPTGTSAVPNGSGVVFDGLSFYHTLGSTNAGGRNIISGNLFTGVALGGNNATLLGNYIGLDVTGSNALPNFTGITVNVAFNTIGGLAPGSANYIADNYSYGIEVYDTGGNVGGDATVVQGNFIGEDANGHPAPNGNDGINIFGTFDNTFIGNVIAYNRGNGVTVVQIAGNTISGNGQIISQNSIFSNLGLGIDLGNDGVTTNHSPSIKVGANNLLNSPVLTSATRSGTNLTVIGSLSAAPKTYTVEFFGNDICSPSGYGQGQVFLASEPVTTDASSNANFTFTIPIPNSVGGVITATATDPGNNGGTSEFSECIGAGNPVDLAVSTIAPTSSFIASNLTFTITVTNNGPSGATGVMLADSLPAFANFISATASQGTFNQANGVVTFNVGNLAAGTTATMTVQITSTVPGTITNSAVVSADEPDPVPLNNYSQNTPFIFNTTPADVAISMTAVPSVTAHQEFTYNLSITNHGPGQATAVEVFDNLPQPHEIVALDTDHGTATYNNGFVDAKIGTLAPGGSAHIAIVLGFASASVLTNTATVTENETDPNLTNNTATVTTAITPLPPLADLFSFGVGATPSPAMVGQQLTYNGSYNNQLFYGSALNVFITNQLPPGVTFVSATSTVGTFQETNGVVVFSAGTLTPGNGIGFTIVVVPNHTGTLTNIDVAVSSVPDADPSDNIVITTTAVVASTGLADLAIASSGPTSPVAAGNAFSYTLFVTNNGLDPATGIVVTDILPPGQTYVSSSGTSGTAAVTNNVVTWLIPSLGTNTSNDGAIITITVDPTFGGTFTNVAAVYADQQDSYDGNNVALQTTTVTGAQPPPAMADLSVSKIGSPNPVTAGSNLSYTITVTNAGPDAATNTTAIDTLPSGVTFISATGGIQPVNGVLTFAVGTLASGGSASLTVVVQPTAAGNVTNSVTVSSATTDPVAGNNLASAVTTVVAPVPPAMADLSVSKFGSPNPVTVGSNLTYTITVTNAGPDAATNTVAIDALPSGVTFVSATGGIQPVSGVLTFAVGTLASGGSANLTVVIQPTAAGSVTNSVTVSSATTDPAAGNNSASAVTSVIAPPPPASSDLAITKTASPNPVTVGSNLTYTISVTNAGPSAATNTSVVDTLPPGVAFISTTGGAQISTNGLIFALGTMASGASTNITVIVQPNAVGNITNFVTVSSVTADPVPTNNTATVITTVVALPPPPSADLAITKTAAPNPVTIGSNLTYTISFTNAGPDTATNAVATDTLPGSVAFVSATGGVQPVNAALTFPLGTLAPGAGSNVTVVVQPTVVGDITNVVTITSGTADPVPANNSASVVTTVVAPPPPTVDLLLAMTAAPEPVTVGNPLTYSLTVTNLSATTASQVVVTNFTPAGVSLVTVLPSQGTFSTNGGVVRVSLGSVAGGAEATVAIVVTPAAAGFLTNRATVASFEADSQPTNNIASAASTVVDQQNTNLALNVLSGLTLNPQTGLFEQQVQASNLGASLASAVRVLVFGLTAPPQILYNASGVTNGTPYVQSNLPLPVGSNVVFHLEYYSSTRRAPTNLTFQVQLALPATPPSTNGTVLNIDRMVSLPSGAVLIEFTATPGLTYAIQYSADMQTWHTAVPVIVAPANRVQWLDEGPPKTESAPSTTSQRFYRVLQIPSL